MIAPYYKVQFAFEDVDQFTETTRAWDLDFWQLECGPFQAELSQVGLPGIQLSKARFNRSLHQTGSPPAGGRTFAIPNNPNFDIVWRGQPVGANEVMSFPLGGELESTSDRHFDVLTVTLSEDLLERKRNSLELGARENVLSSQEVSTADPRLLFALRLQLNRIHGLSQQDFLRKQTAIEAELDSLISMLLLGWSSSAPNERTRQTQSRVGLIKAATVYINTNLRRPLSISELCRHCSTSERTLQYAFRQHYQCTPKQYIQARRLHGVRKDLIKYPRQLVAQIANNWGFWHMGQFASDYKRLFGEPPSRTRR